MVGWWELESLDGEGEEEGEDEHTGGEGIGEGGGKGEEGGGDRGEHGEASDASNIDYGGGDPHDVGISNRSNTVDSTCTHGF